MQQMQMEQNFEEMESRICKSLKKPSKKKAKRVERNHDEDSTVVAVMRIEN